MKRPAENPGRSTRLARAATDPSTEYAGALMWKRGSEVMKRSSPVSCIQYGNPSPAITYARWVCMTSFDRPVVPEVGIMTATSAGSTSAGPRPSLSPSKIRSTSTRGVPPMGAASASVTINAGRTCSTNPATSASVLAGLTATWTAPTSMSASQVSRYGGVLRAVTRTRSPAPIPEARSHVAARSTRASAWA